METSKDIKKETIKKPKETDDDQRHYCPISLTLLSEITTGDQLKFKSDKTGTEYDARPEDTMLYSEENTEQSAKYKNIKMVAPYDPVNPKIRIPDGCEKCNRKIVGMLRLGEDKKVIYVCICGNIF